jgi:feruloyl esterase
MEIVARRYGRRPARLYYMGSSEGGREGLAMAQRFPADYDGVISRVPVINWTGLQHAGHRSGLVQQNGGWLNPAKVQLVSRGVLAACDELDGLADGIVSHYLACGAVFTAQALRCPTGRNEGDACLSNAQVAALEAVHAPFEFPFTVANGVRAYPGFGHGGEAQTGGYPQWVTGTTAAAFPVPAGGTLGQQWTFGSATVRYFILQSGQSDPFRYVPAEHAARIQRISALMDATNPDLSAFAARGGKLILKEHLADYAQSPFAGIRYYESVVARLGQAAVDRFARLYVTPGAAHGGAGTSGATGAPIPQYVDLLGTLDRWVERGDAPGDLVQASVETSAPFAVTASRPMCRYPAYPRYRGTGDPRAAASFTCSAP